jgi:hypothetical protein
MNRSKLHVSILIGFLTATLYVSPATAVKGPSDGKAFRGRIAFSADGNHNDPDDWAASPVALAIFAQAGFKDRVVHFHYNCILPENDPEWAKIHAESVLGAAERYGYDLALFHDCQKDLDGAVEAIARAINASSADDPLYFIVAGPMEVPLLGIKKADPAKRQFVYCISHSQWNDGFARDYSFTNTKRDLFPLGIRWVQIPDQNRAIAFSRYGSPAKPEEFEPYFWMRDSKDPRLQFLWERMVVSTRPDPSDAGMAWFLVTGDQTAEVTGLRALLEHGALPEIIDCRSAIRLEAENFVEHKGYELEYRNDRKASHKVNARLAGGSSGRIETRFQVPYSAESGRYSVAVRFLDEGPPFTMALFVNGQRQKAPWKSPGSNRGWTTHTVSGVEINDGDSIAVETKAEAGGLARLDYVQLNLVTATSQLDDPDALPGQIIVAGTNPGYLKYNGGGPVFLCGPDNPEDFLFRGKLNADGTRSGSEQEVMIERMAKAGVNGFHCQMFRMRRCNFKDEGDDTHCPFVDHDPSKPLDEDVLDQWDGWLTLLEKRGINVHLEFYNDATDVEMMGWKLDTEGNLPADEARWIAGIVKRFKHHKNVLWGIEESVNKLPAERTPHFKKIAELIARTDNHNHPIVQSFVVPNDPDGDFPEDGITSDAYIGDPNVRVVTWLHIVPHGDDLEKQHAEYLHYMKRDAAKFVVMKNETFHHPKKGSRSRRYMWSCAMTGMQCLEAYHHADDSPDAILREDGYINRFLERTDIHTMKPHDELAAGSTRWVLANPGKSYVAYTYDYRDRMGVKRLPPGSYELLWLDTVDGTEVTQTVRVSSTRDATWEKPDSIGDEIALSIKPYN